MREYPDQTITDRFHIVEKYDSSEDGDGNCYDWYVIGDHYRFTDKFSSRVIETEIEITDHDIAILLAEQEITDLDLRVMALENKEEE